MRFFCVLALFLLSTSCTPTSLKDDVSPIQHRQWAKELLSINDLKGATEEMRLSLAGNPNIEDALLYADLLDTQGEFKKSRSVYKNAFKLPADSAQKNDLVHRLALLEVTEFDNIKAAAKLAESLPPVDTRLFDLRSVILFQQKQYKQALEESLRALAKAVSKEEKAWAYFHMAQIYYELRVERDTFASLFEAVNHGRGYGLVKRITDYWESIRHDPFPKD